MAKEEEVTSTIFPPGAIAQQSYQTRLSAQREAAFRNWVARNKIEFDPNDPKSDYDMRGFWQAYTQGDPRATRAFNAQGEYHFPDIWKTPYNRGFSDQSVYALPGGAPHWAGPDGGSLLELPNNDLIFDTRKGDFSENLNRPFVWTPRK